MTQQDIIEMIGEAGGYGHNTCEQNEKSFYPFMERFAKLVEEREREKFCAVLRQLHDSYSLTSDSNAIRARGQE